MEKILAKKRKDIKSKELSNFLCVVSNMVKNQLQFKDIPNVIIGGESETEIREFSQDFYEVLEFYKMFPKHAQSKVICTDFPKNRNENWQYALYYERLSRACEYQNRFYGIYCINLDGINDLDDDTIANLLTFIRKNSDNAKFVLWNVSDAICKKLYTVNCSFVTIEREKKEENAYTFFNEFCRLRKINVSETLRDVACRSLLEMEKENWTHYMSQFVCFLYQYERLEDAEKFFTEFKPRTAETKTIGFSIKK